tara:strand:+ start:417 stop:2057 length:1641 start_codon:yes stop_codon:yes gene_type:complete
MNSKNLLNNKKTILDNYNRGKLEKVIKLGKKFLKTKNDFQILYALGLTYLTLKDYLEAEKYFKNIILLKPNAENYYIYGNIQKQLKNYNEASENFLKAINLKSDYSEAYNNLGNTKFKLGFIGEAVENYQKAIKYNKKNIPAYFNLAHVYSEEKNFNDLKKVLQEVLKFDENNTTALNDLGYLSLILGNVDEGRKLFERVIDIDDKHIRAFKNYFLITKAVKGDNFLKKLEKLDLISVNDEDKIIAYTCLSKCNFDLNKTDLAFKYLDEANKIKKKNSNFSLQAEKKLFENIKNIFKQNETELTKHNYNIKFTPIFILGMPRSGTTFLEQVLSSHSIIYGAGELNYLPKIIDNIKLDKLQNLDTIIKNIRSEYYEKVLQLSNKKFIIDKLPMNFRWIGFIAKAFPEAKIIHIQRNPMAICWSNYKINFPDPGMDFSLTQKDTAKYYILYEDLMKFWFDKFKERIININYENFVNNFENEIRSLIKKLGINWEENIKNYSKNARPVQTASLLQVRGSIKKNTSEEWKKYRVHLKIMQETLDSAKIKY